MPTYSSSRSMSSSTMTLSGDCREVGQRGSTIRLSGTGMVDGRERGEQGRRKQLAL